MKHQMTTVFAVQWYMLEKEGRSNDEASEPITPQEAKHRQCGLPQLGA